MFVSGRPPIDNYGFG